MEKKSEKLARAGYCCEEEQVEMVWRCREERMRFGWSDEIQNVYGGRLVEGPWPRRRDQVEMKQLAGKISDSGRLVWKLERIPFNYYQYRIMRGTTIIKLVQISWTVLHGFSPEYDIKLIHCWVLTGAWQLNCGHRCALDEALKLCQLECSLQESVWK